ncbi:phosphotransferase [Albidovulum sediminicola]|uniref:Hydroxylysine kinase n=1 Tax=Albidovulum sediminicola TaxID=2984331 RepID=A0ABT2Z5I7_9RHOB|nr:phosphotransferase [Defluviimonas sp. WL0075]MCV2866041.1 phosphotransferase [Defluviimonas sp. WL0075]
MTAASTAPSLTAAPPAFSPAEALALAERTFGRTGRLDPLTSERDLNFRLTTATGDSFVLKIGNAAEPAEVSEFQTAALRHIAARDPDLPVPRVVPALDGRIGVPLPGGEILRMLTWVEGHPMHRATSSPALRQSLGATAARLTRALEGFEHPGADHELLWDIKNAARVRPFLPSVTDARLHDLVALWLDRFEAEIAPALGDLPWQVVHADLNPFNVLTDAEGRTVTGILDFGDMVCTPRICDLAVAASYHADPARPLDTLAEVVGAWHTVLPLTPAEARAMPDLIAMRMVLTVVIAHWRAGLYPDNAAYILRNVPASGAGLAALTQAGRDTARARVAQILEARP